MHEQERMLLAAKRRLIENSAGIVAPQYRPWKEGRSALGGTHTNKVPEAFKPIKAPNVNTRVSPGSVPGRRRGHRPEMMNGL